METRKVSEIVVTGRTRANLGEMAGLRVSLDAVGMLHPIVINTRNELIAGQRRLAAAAALGWETVPVNVVASLDDARVALIAERDENYHRMPMSVAEMVELGRKIEAIEKPEARKRQGSHGAAPGKPKGSPGNDEGSRGNTSANFAEVFGEARSRQKVAEALGVSHETYRKAKAVVEAAEKEPERFGDLAAKLAEPKAKADPVYREMKRRQEEPKAKPEPERIVCPNCGHHF